MVYLPEEQQVNAAVQPRTFKSISVRPGRKHFATVAIDDGI